MPDDAIYVYCNMTSSGGETCIYPDAHASKMPNIPWRRTSERASWFSTLRGGFKVRSGVFEASYHLILPHNI